MADLPVHDRIRILERHAWIYAVLGDTRQGIAAAEKVLNLTKLNVNAMILLGVLHTCQGDYDASIQALQYASQRHNRHIVAGVLLAAVRHMTDCMSTDQFSKELVLFIDAVEVLDGYATGTTPVAATSPGSFIGHAEPDFGSVARIANRICGYYLLIAKVALSRGCHFIADVALQAGLECVKGRQDSSVDDVMVAGLLALRSWRLAAMGKVDEAECAAHGGLAIMPNDREANDCLAAIALSAVNSSATTEALFWSRTAVVSRPVSAQSQSRMAEGCRRQEDFSKATDFLMCAAEAEGNEPVVPLDLLLLVLQP
jgi:tetratricopeptide (TPR) repeat protein